MTLPLPLTAVSGLLSESVEPLIDPRALASMSDDALLSLVQDAECLGRAVDGLRVLAAGEVVERSRATLGPERLSAKRGCRTPAEVLERAALVSGQTARARIQLATRVQSTFTLTGELLPGAFPSVRESLASGALSTDAAAAIVSYLAPVLERGHAVDATAGTDPVRTAECELVAAALAGETADDVRLMAQTWALFLDQDGALPDERGNRERPLSLGRERNGTVPVRGALLPEVAAQLQRLLDAFLNPKVGDGPRFVAGETDACGGTRAGDADASPHESGIFRDDPEPRTPAQKRHDALAGILTVSAVHDSMPRLGGAAPTLIVAATPDQLAAPRGLAFLQGGAQTGAPVSASVARHIGCLGAVQRLVLSPDGRIIELGNALRVFSAAQRRAITVRDGECVIPGCHVPGAWCEIHHVHEHSRGGPTHTDNGVLLCWHHHRTIETGGWEIEMRRGVPWVRPPGWIDAHRAWRPGGRSAIREWARLRASGGAPP
ncbi:HNH endonuclease signature motif containing protein [Microbacterium sp. cx-59]|uniref:HNH endonuclease signature motif containing protein n=1 Tax=Microbacterium sp. cx-59 TaxID=2891207 RepID=UPI001E4ADA94|nr:HNH endonuclease signature motif containing protein [Microbacterium sp. cx-59]MCC4907016.1 HNH endonuclease [Microbacterium sp. cx-59]